MKVKNDLDGLTWFQHVHPDFHGLFSARVVAVALALCCYTQVSSFADSQETFSEDGGSRCPWK